MVTAHRFLEQERQLLPKQIQCTILWLPLVRTYLFASMLSQGVALPTQLACRSLHPPLPLYIVHTLQHSTVDRYT